MEGDIHIRRMMSAIVIIAGIFLLNIAVADACGDKSLRIGRGIRFRRTAHPAAVLIYIPSNAKRATQLHSMLRKVGHKSHAVQGVDGVSEALKSGQYDLIFADVADAPSLEKRIQASASKPRLVPVVSNGTKAEVAAAKMQYKYFVKNPHSADHYLEAIDEAMRSRARVFTKNGQKT